MNKALTYSITVPVFNSRTLLKELCSKILTSLQSVPFELILVDDGSIDNSWQVINEIKNENPAIIRAIRLSKNYGQHAALLCAFSYCTGDYIITIDDDLQYDPADILRLIKAQVETNAEIVYGTHPRQNHSTMRNTTSRLNMYVSQLEGSAIEGSSLRLIKKSIVKAIVENNRNSFLFLDDILKWYTSSYAGVPVNHYPRKEGKSGYTFKKLLKIYINKMVNYTAFPLKLMIYAGILFSGFSFISGFVSIYHKIVANVPLGYTSIIVAIFFCSGVIMFCLGVIGQYLSKLYLLQQNKPMYSINQVI